MTQTCDICGHIRALHGQEREFDFTDSKRELCRLCTDESTVTDYPKGKQWHRFREEGKAQ